MTTSEELKNDLMKNPPYFSEAQADHILSKLEQEKNKWRNEIDTKSFDERGKGDAEDIYVRLDDVLEILK